MIKDAKATNRSQCKLQKMGPNRGLNPGPLAYVTEPKARIIPLDHSAKQTNCRRWNSGELFLTIYVPNFGTQNGPKSVQFAPKIRLNYFSDRKWTGFLVLETHNLEFYE